MWAGLDFDGAGNLYATTNLANNFLTTINPNTGAFSNPRGSGLTAGFTLSDLSWDRLNNRMLGLATVCATAKIGPRWKPTRNEVSASAGTMVLKSGVNMQKHERRT